jgi:hypothetical protein
LVCARTVGPRNAMGASASAAKSAIRKRMDKTCFLDFLLTS